MLEESIKFSLRGLIKVLYARTRRRKRLNRPPSRYRRLPLKRIRAGFHRSLALSYPL
jgi:hypothetical protein